MTISQIRHLASQYLAPDKMVWLVVGDARTQLPRLAALGFGRPTVISPAAVAR
jgi:zinc protease